MFRGSPKQAMSSNLTAIGDDAARFDRSNSDPVPVFRTSKQWSFWADRGRCAVRSKY
jgi:hypothetical protein